MASVVACVLGGQPKRVEVSTVEGAKNALGLTGNYTASVNGETAELSDALTANDYVTFSQQVKGGQTQI